MKREVIGDCTLYLGDCLEVWPKIEGTLDAVVSDPPYGGNYDTDSTRFTGGKRSSRGDGRNDRIIHGDDKEFDPRTWLRFKEVILWGANFYSQKLPVGSTLVWLKKYLHQYGTFLSDAEIGWQKGGCGVYAFHAPDSNGRRRMELTGSPFGKETAHPTQKPVALMAWCLSRIKGRKILDPFMGSGTTGIACLGLGYKFTGIEIDPVYFDLACRRIEEVHRQPNFLVKKTVLEHEGENLEMQI